MSEYKIKTTMSEYKATYWNDIAPKQNIWNKLIKENVPSFGSSDTLHGELIRAGSRLYYEYFNNGNCNATLYDEDYEHDYNYEKYSYEVRESGVKPFYYKFIKLIKEQGIEEVNTVQKIIALEGGFSDKNMESYDKMIDAIIEHISLTKNSELPSDYITD